MKNKIDRKQRMKWLIFALAVLWTAVIWWNSSQTAAQSSAHSLQVTSILAPLLTRLNISHTIWHSFVRKLAHVAEFGLLSLLWSLFIHEAGKKMIPQVFISCGLCMLTALIDETLQLFVPGRAGRIADVWIDLSGACLGALAAAAAVTIKRKWGRNRRSSSEHKLM